MQTNDICFQGEHYAFSEIAAKNFLGEYAICHLRETFEQDFQTVKNNKNMLGIIPIENTLSGSIHQNYDLLLEGDLYIVGEIFLRVSHYLITNRGVSRRKVKRIFSHPQAIAQCKKYLSKYPKLEIVPVSNTAGAVRKIKDVGYEDAAAIVSMQAAIDYNLDVLAEEIEDFHNKVKVFSTIEFIL